MKYRFGKYSFSFFAVIFLYFFFQGQAAADPVMVLKENKANVGEVLEGTEIKHDFTVYNMGDDPLVIEKVKPG